VYPNPVKNQLQIVGVETDNYPSLQIYDVVGQCVGTYGIRPENTETTIDVSHLAKGMYYLKVDGKTVKFVKE
jgi:hypothetical protein